MIRTKNKYHNKKIIKDGQVFDSLKEYRRFCELALLQRAGQITNLQRQVPFELIPAQFQEIQTGEFYKRGERKGQPKTKRICIENSVVYKADFVYTEKGKMVVEDAKGFKTTDFILKRKMMLYFHNIKIKEV